MKNCKTLAPLLLAMMVSPMAFAQEASQQQEQTQAQQAQQQGQGEAAAQESRPSSGWQELDKDGNGSLSKTEAAGVPSLSQIFEQADSNQDGELSQDEYKAFLNAGQTPPTQDEVKQ